MYSAPHVLSRVVTHEYSIVLIVLYLWSHKSITILKRPDSALITDKVFRESRDSPPLFSWKCVAFQSLVVSRVVERIM